MCPLRALLTGPPPVGSVAAIESWLPRVGGSAHRVPLPQQLREPAVREVTRRPHEGGLQQRQGLSGRSLSQKPRRRPAAHADGSRRPHVTSGVGGHGIGSADASGRGQKGLGRVAPGLLGVQAQSPGCRAHRGPGSSRSGIWGQRSEPLPVARGPAWALLVPEREEVSPTSPSRAHGWRGGSGNGRKGNK